MSKLPFMQFYPADWLQDTQILSLEAQGAWIKILCALHAASERGRKTSATRQWQQFLGYPEDDRALLLLGELQEVADIDARDQDGNASNLSNAVEITISSRRMIRDEVKRNQELERKRRYEDANPTRKRRASDGNPTPIYQKSEVRSHISEEDKSSASGAGFKQFWEAYPKKRARGDAEKAWKAVKPDPSLLAAILRAIEQQARSPEWTKDAGQFIPYPASWLRAKRWQDGVEHQAEVARRVPLVVSPSNGAGDKPLPRDEAMKRLRELTTSIGRT